LEIIGLRADCQELVTSLRWIEEFLDEYELFATKLLATITTEINSDDKQFREEAR